MKVYKYGLASPSAERDRILDQMHCAHRYRNVLVEIERGRRAAERATLSAVAPESAALEAAVAATAARVDAAILAIRRERARTRKRSEPEALKAKLKAAKDAKKIAFNALRDLRRTLRESPTVAAERDRISELALGLGRGARALSGLAKSGPHYGAWGTYQLVEEAAKQSFSDLPLFAPDGVTPQDPRFERWNGCSKAVSVQIQGGADWAAVTSGEHPQLRITPPDERAWLKVPENGWAARRRFARQGQLQLCLGTDANGERVYGTWRLDMHRPLPRGATIKRATVHCRETGPHHEWSLDLVIDAPEPAVQPATVGGAVALDVGWRLMGGELRVVGWSDSAGDAGELRLDAALIAALRAPDHVRSRRDSLFDLAVLRLARFLDVNPAVPDAVRDAAEGLKTWKSAARLRRLRDLWREAGPPVTSDGAHAYAALDAWAGQDWFDWERESRLRDAALRRRRDLYRVFAYRLAQQYDTIVLEQFDLRALARKAPVEGGAENETARSNRQLAALSELRDCVINAARAAGRTVPAMPSADTTRQCPACGVVADRDAESTVVLHCRACDAKWDQDVQGAAPVLLGRWRERPADAKILVAARADSAVPEKAESRRARVARLRQEKLDRMRKAS